MSKKYECDSDPIIKEIAWNALLKVMEESVSLPGGAGMLASSVVTIMKDYEKEAREQWEAE